MAKNTGTPLPKWNDEPRVDSWVNSVLDGEMDARAQAAIDRYSGSEGETRSLFSEMKERQAARAALSKPSLVAALRSDEPLTRLQQTTIADLLEGKPKRRGRPKQPVEQRLRRSFIHYVAAEVDRIEALLRQHFAEERRIRGRAVEIAATRWDFRIETIENYLKSRRRIRLPSPK